MAEAGLERRLSGTGDAECGVVVLLSGVSFSLFIAGVGVAMFLSSQCVCGVAVVLSVSPPFPSLIGVFL